MLILKNKVLIFSILLNFCLSGIFVATEGYVSLGLLGNYPASVIPYFYFSQAVLALIIIRINQKFANKNYQSYLYAYYMTVSTLTAICYFLISIKISGAIFCTAAFLVVIYFQTFAVIGNTIALVYNIREFHQVAYRLTVAQGLGGICFAILLPLLINLIGGIILIPTIIALYVACLVISSQLKPRHEFVDRHEHDKSPVMPLFFRPLFLYAVIVIVVAVLIDYLYKIVLKQNFGEKEIGMVSTCVAGMIFFTSILTQVFIQRRFAQGYGIVNTLLIFPIFVILFSVLVFIFPGAVTVILIYGLSMVILYGPRYIAYETLLNTIPNRIRVVAKSRIYLLGMVYGRSLIAASILILLGEKYASIRVVIGIAIVFGLLAIPLIKRIKTGYVGNLKNQVENSRYLGYENIYTEEDDIGPQNIADVIPQIGRRYTINQTLSFLKGLNVDPIPYLVNNLRNSKDIINFQARVKVLGKLPSPDVEGYLTELMNCSLALLPDTIPFTIATRSLSGLSTAFCKIIEIKLVNESKIIVSLRRAIKRERSETIRVELKSRLDLASHRFFYYFASVTNPREVLNTLPQLFDRAIGKSDKNIRANAIEYLENITEDKFQRNLLHNTFEKQYPPISKTEYSRVLFEDPWLSRIANLAEFKPGAQMNTIEKSLFLRGVTLFEVIPGELLELISESLSEIAIKENEVIFRKGDIGDKMYMIVSGIVNIESDGQHLSELSRYGLFGELSLINSSPRRGTASAKTDVVLLYLDKENFTQLIEDVPTFSKAVIRQLMDYLSKYSNVNPQ